jgi:hypothetical protein
MSGGDEKKGPVRNRTFFCKTYVFPLRGLPEIAILSLSRGISSCGKQGMQQHG